MKSQEAKSNGSSVPTFQPLPAKTKQLSAAQENNLSEMTEYDKFMLVNRSKTVEDLIEVVKLLEKNGGIPSNYAYAPGELVNTVLQCYMKEWAYSRVTRSYGIRQQLIYIMYYEGKIHLL